MRINAEWLASPQSQAVCRALEDGGYKALFVGGCVRNELLHEPVTDLDLATDAHPEQTLSALSSAGLKAVPTGIEHGTITAVSDGQPYEITTFREDVETDGRHAVVRFSDSVARDAARRDFTMNALYSTSSGELIDPIGGLSDLRARRLRFIGNADMRIAEDYLRILRFFRFQAWYADPAQGVDEEGLAACAAGADGLAKVSAERIWSELKKLLSAPNPGLALGAMAASGILVRVLPGADPKPIAPLVHLEGLVGVNGSAMRRLSALGGPDMTADLRLSRAEARAFKALRDGLGSGENIAPSAWRHGLDTARDIALIVAASVGGDLPPGFDAELARGAAAVFPVTASDLMPAYTGLSLGLKLTELQDAWVDSDLTLTKDALLKL